MNGAVGKRWALENTLYSSFPFKAIFLTINSFRLLSFSPSPPSLFSPSNLLQLALSSLRLLSLAAFFVFTVASF
jgi:hypothetical protein